MLRNNVPAEVTALIQFLMTKAKFREPLDIAIPQHSFFMIPGWANIFQRANPRLVRSHHNTINLIAKGTTQLEEQDIGLFLRWLQPYVAPHPRLLGAQRLAEVSHECRPHGTGLVYFVNNEALCVSYKTQRPIPIT